MEWNVVQVPEELVEARVRPPKVDCFLLGLVLMALTTEKKQHFLAPPKVVKNSWFNYIIILSITLMIFCTKLLLLSVE